MFQLFTYLSVEAGEEVVDIMQELEKIRDTPVDKLIAQLQGTLRDYLPRIIGVIFLIVFGHVLIGGVRKLLRKLLKRSKVDPTLHSFIIQLVKIVLYILFGVIGLSVMKIPTAPLLAAIGTAGLALSLAIKDSLANISGGISVLFSRPFAKGDLVEVKGVLGTVQRIELVYTLIATDDGRLVYMPNGDLSKSVITNFSKEPLEKLELALQMPATADFAAAKELITAAFASVDYVLHNPEPIISIAGQQDGMLTISCKIWVKQQSIALVTGPLKEELENRLKHMGEA